MSAAPEALIEEVRRLDAAATEALARGLRGSMSALLDRYRTLAPQLATELEATAAALAEARADIDRLRVEKSAALAAAESYRLSLTHYLDGSSTVRQLDAETRAKAAEERVRVLEANQAEDATILQEIRDTLRNADIPSTIAALRAALEPLADMFGSDPVPNAPDGKFAGSVTYGEVRAARRALGRAE